jgi:hypothetical protein
LTHFGETFTACCWNYPHHGAFRIPVSKYTKCSTIQRVGDIIVLLAFSAGALCEGEQLASYVKVFLCKVKKNMTVQIILSNDDELL